MTLARRLTSRKITTITNMDTEQKLNILTDSSKYDLACACKTGDQPGRVRGDAGRWIYPAVLPSGRKVFLLKTLQSNDCVNDCSYCPFNSRKDVARCTLEPAQLASVFMQLREAGRVDGLFLSSGVCGNADQTMAKMLATVELLRKRHLFRGFIHMKVIPGASDEAVNQAVQQATRVSVNIESPNAKRLGKLTSRKRFHEDIISTMQSINRARKAYNRKCSQTTQFVVGAAGESDREIVLSTERLYSKIDIERVYFSAYQDFENPPEPSQKMLFEGMTDKSGGPADNIFVREHRLYQVDFLLRKYNFSKEDILYDTGGNLSLRKDPKQVWADHHPELFPLDVNRASKEELLRVPGIGPISVNRIIKGRKQEKIQWLDDLKRLGVRTSQGRDYLTLKR
ncbi:MAG: radical SAM protein [Phycisphaerae bacterium]|nr:radical SAM protein [Phycisphaerae bacterium]